MVPNPIEKGGIESFTWDRLMHERTGYPLQIDASVPMSTAQYNETMDVFTQLIRQYMAMIQHKMIQFGIAVSNTANMTRKDSLLATKLCKWVLSTIAADASNVEAPSAAIMNTTAEEVEKGHAAAAATTFNSATQTEPSTKTEYKVSHLLIMKILEQHVCWCRKCNPSYIQECLNEAKALAMQLSKKQLTEEISRELENEVAPKAKASAINKLEHEETRRMIDKLVQEALHKKAPMNKG